MFTESCSVFDLKCEIVCGICLYSYKLQFTNYKLQVTKLQVQWVPLNGIMKKLINGVKCILNEKSQMTFSYLIFLFKLIRLLLYWNDLIKQLTVKRQRQVIKERQVREVR
jgi:hypothetical protein